MTHQILPNIEEIIDPIIGLSYAQYDCWNLLRFVFEKGWHISFEQNPAEAIQQVQEIWWQSSMEDPFALVQRWDICIFTSFGFASQHVGVMVNGERMVHTKPRMGVCLEYLRRWRPRLLQIARLRRLL